MKPSTFRKRGEFICCCLYVCESRGKDHQKIRIWGSIIKRLYDSDLIPCIKAMHSLILFYWIKSNSLSQNQNSSFV